MFDSIPKPVINMLVQMLKNAAPELVPQLEQVADIVISFKAQADRIEANQRLIMAHLGLTEDHDDGRNDDEIEQQRAGTNRQVDASASGHSRTSRKTGTTLARNSG